MPDLTHACAASFDHVSHGSFRGEAGHVACDRHTAVVLVGSFDVHEFDVIGILPVASHIAVA